MTAKKTDDTTPLKAGDGDVSNTEDETIARAVRVDKSYVERPYKDAMTKEQRETLKEEGLL